MKKLHNANPFGGMMPSRSTKSPTRASQGAVTSSERNNASSDLPTLADASEDKGRTLFCDQCEFVALSVRRLVTFAYWGLEMVSLYTTYIIDGRNTYVLVPSINGSTCAMQLSRLANVSTFPPLFINLDNMILLCVF